jgi:3-oxoacyl-[acyl-carrier-protein] synthase II
MLAGEIGIAPISFWDASDYSTKVAAEVRHVPQDTGSSCIAPSQSRRAGRLLLPVVREALSDAGEGSEALESEEVGLAVGTSVNWVDLVLMKHYFRFRDQSRKALDFRQFHRDGRQPEGSLMRRTGDMVGALTAKALGLAGPLVLIDTACAASAHAIGEAFRMVRRGKVRAMVAGGTCCHATPISILAFSLLGALSRARDPEEASRPFDKLRDGFVMGEGAGAVVLENLESAQSRGARIYAEVAGCGMTLNAYNLTDPSPDGAPEARAMTLALAEASMAPEEVGMVAAHGTSTPKNDANETVAIKRVFADHARRLLVFSNKGQIGHTISTAGVANLICAVKAMMDNRVPPTMNLRNPDPECDLDYVPNTSRKAEVRAALVNAFAFGGQNIALALRAWEGA